MGDKPYVLFREDTDSHKEIFYVGDGEVMRRTSTDPADAQRFGSAREAYEHGASVGMQWWKVGKR
jgi:hypothetical protein